MVTKRLTDRAAAAQGWTLAQLAKAMGVSKQHMTEWRAGRAPMPENAVIRAAELAGSDPASTLVDYLAERSQGDAHRVWMEIRRRTLGPLADQGGR